MYDSAWSTICSAGLRSLALGLVAAALLACGEGLRKSSSETEEFACTLNSSVEDGLMDQEKAIPFSGQCIAKKGPVQFANLRVVLIRKESGNKVQSGGEVLVNSNITVTPDRPYEFSGVLNQQGPPGLSQRRSLTLQAEIHYPDEPERDYEADRIERASNAWRYNLLVTKKL